jgi:hypothetical protein
MRCVVSFMHVYLAAIGLDVLPGYAEDTTESTAAEPLVSGCRPISRRAAHLGEHPNGTFHGTWASFA